MSGETLFPRSVVEDFAREGFARGWDEALQAARDAVAAAKAVDISAGHLLDDSRYFIWMHDALAAIDALRGEG